LVDWLKEKGALGEGLEVSVTGAVAGKDAELETERAGFKGCSASAGAGVVALGKEKA
jgi:hypothetical protein